MIINDKDALYLSALLEYIPTGTAQEFLNNACQESFKTYLGLANKYALSGKGEIVEGTYFTFLASPFELLNKKEEDVKPEWKMQAKPLSLSKDAMPKLNNASEVQNIKNCWQGFDEELAKMVGIKNSGLAITKAVENLLLKWASNIPNPSNVNQDVSWYDYARTKAGLALCLWEYSGGEEVFEIKNEEYPLRIIRADISGIQSFIYDIASKQASKNLKGRSFYVQLLSDAVMRKVIEHLGLKSGNIMYASGGNFFVIAPNTEKVQKDLAEVEKVINTNIFETHKGRIAVVLGSKEVSQEEVLKGQINQAIKRLFEEEVDRNKKRKFASYIASNYEKFFEPIDQGGEIYTDAITGEEIDTNKEDYYLVQEGPVLPGFQKKGYPLNKDGNHSFLTVNTGKQIFLGHQLKKAKCILVGRNLPDDEKTVEPCRLGFSYKVLDDSNYNPENFKAANIEEILVLNEARIDLPAEVAYKKRDFFYGGHESPTLQKSDLEQLDKKDIGQDRKQGDIKQFHELAMGEGAFNRLAVLRMDLDGLGGLFKDLTFSSLSFSYYAALSRSLDWFFRGYLNTIWSANNDFHNYSQIIYSGGDDLFLIGRWDVIVDFAEEIKKQFDDFTCRTGNLTISGGISIVTDKFPIMKGADFAAHAEKAAKGHKLEANVKQAQKGFEKNSINLLGMSLHWDTEFELVKELKDELVLHIVKRKSLSKSFLGKISMHHKMMQQFEKDKRDSLRVNPRWVWMVTYDFTRFIKQQKASSRDFVLRMKNNLTIADKQYLKEKLEFLDFIKKAVFINRYTNSEGHEKLTYSKYHFLELLNLAARWAELVYRSKNQNKNNENGE